jgi:hypothetical protein
MPVALDVFYDALGVGVEGQFVDRGSDQEGQIAKESQRLARFLSVYVTKVIAKCT